MAQNFNVSPYYDDFDPAKEFYRILFQPGRAVQARELTQIQSMLQNQISSFGQNIFAEGSLVSGGQTSLDDSAFYLKVNSTYTDPITSASTTVDYSTIVGQYIVEQGTGKIGYVKQYLPSVGTDPTTLYVSIISGPQTPFTDNSTYYVVANPIIFNPVYYFTSQSTCSGESLLYHINPAVFFAIGTFCYCPLQTLVVGKYTKSPSAVVGLNIVESVVNYTNDPSLLDPALGASNYLAPGADRYKIDLQLIAQTYTAIATTYPAFIQLTTIVNGAIVNNITTPIYSTIMDTMAKRSYDTNGNFIVKNFLPTLKNDPQNLSNLILSVSAGAAFVLGYEIETISPTSLSLAKARSTATDLQTIVNTSYGNYTYVNTITGSLPDITSTSETFTVQIHSVATGQSSATQIGTALVRGFEYSSGTGSSVIYGMFLDNVVLTGNSIGVARSFYVPAGTYSTYAFSAIIDGSAIINGITQLFFPSSTDLVFNLPRNYASTLANVGYYYRQYITAVVSGSTVTFSCKTTDQFSPGSGLSLVQNFTIVDENTGLFIPLDTSTLVLTHPYQATITFPTGSYTGHTLSILATVRTTNDGLKTKTLVSNQLGAVSTITGTASQTLLYSDVYELTSVFEFPTTSTYRGAWSSVYGNYAVGDVVSLNGLAYTCTNASNSTISPTLLTVWSAINNNILYYNFNTGQTDGYYDHGSYSRNSKPTTTVQALPVFKYFTHSGFGYLTSQSYPNGVDYGSIPYYTSLLGTTYQLRNCIDFRPRRTDGAGAFALQAHQIPQSLTNSDVNTDITYYLGRIDKVVLTRDGVFKVLQGKPAYLDPEPPIAQSDSITLFVLNYEPYTINISNVNLKIIPYKRYTMKDISTLDNRLTNVEYYTTLNTLESKTNSTVTTNSNSGQALFNNGFVTDTFNGSGIGDVTNRDYRASLDYKNGIARPTYKADNVYLSYNPNSSNTVTSNVFLNSLVTVPYTSNVFVNQPIASNTISVNPFGVVSYVGTLRLSPQSDVWFDMNTAPSVVTNIGGANDNYANLAGIETQWNAWQNIWFGEQINDSTSTTDGVSSGGVVSRQVLTQQAGTTSTQSPGVTTSSSTTVINNSVIPYVRSRLIKFAVAGMAANTQLYLYINGMNFTTCLLPPTSNSAASTANVAPAVPVRTDRSGLALGYIFIPNDVHIKFQTGNLNIVISDNSLDWRQSVSYAQSTFYTKGQLPSVNYPVISTKPNGSVTTQLQVNTTNPDQGSVAATANVNISTQIPADPTYFLTSDVSTAREGDTVRFTFYTTNPGYVGSYSANLSGTITNAGLGGGITLGNTTITTTGSLAAAAGYITVPINAAAVTGNNTLELTLTVSVPGGPGAGDYRTSCNIITSKVPSFSVVANNFIYAGNTISVVFTANNLPTNVAVSYALTGSQYVLANTTGDAQSGTFYMYGPNQSNTFNYVVGAGYTAANASSYLAAGFTILDGTGITKNTTTTIVPVQAYAINANTNSIIAGQSVLITVNTVNILTGTTLAYTITGVTSANINGASLTGNMVVNSAGSSNLVIQTLSSISGTQNLKFSIANTTTATANVAIGYVIPNIVGPTAAIPVGTPYSFSITNGPAYGTFVVNNQYGNAAGSGTLNALGVGTYTVAAGSDAAGSYTWTFTFSNGATSTGSAITAGTSGGAQTTVIATAVDPKYNATGPTSVNQTDTMTFTVSSTNQSTAIVVPWNITSVDNDAQIETFTNNSGATCEGLNSGAPNYAAYVQSYPDLIALYTDCVNAGLDSVTTIYGQSYPNNGLFNTPGDEYNSLIQSNSGYVALAKQGINAFGLSHWTGSELFRNSGRSQNRILPTTPYPTGTVTVSDSASASFSLDLRDIYQPTTTGTLSVNFGAPVNQILNVNIVNNYTSLVPQISPVTQKLITTGDFIDSNFTIAQALGQFIFITNGKTNEQIQAAKQSNFITLTSTQAALANSTAQTVAGWYRNASSGLNQNPPLMALLRQVQSIFDSTNSTTVMEYGGQQLYAITTGSAAEDPSTFTQQNAVFVNPASGLSQSGETYIINRTWTCPTTGYYVFVWNVDDAGSMLIDDRPVIALYRVDNFWSRCAFVYVTEGTHTITATVTNGSRSYNVPWSENNAWFAGGIYPYNSNTYTREWSLGDDANTSGTEMVPITEGLIGFWQDFSNGVDAVNIGTINWSFISYLSEVDTTLSGISLESSIAAAQATFYANASTFKTNNGSVGARSQFLACTTDPLAQTFFVSENVYPNGIFLTGLDLFFKTKDSTLPVFAQIRPTVNGYPSSDTVIPLSTVWLTPAEVSTSDNALTPTNFTFSDPVYLPAGQYAIVVGSASFNYLAYIGTVGNTQIPNPSTTGINTIANQPNVGSLFESQNASTWTADQSSDLCFILYQASFKTGKSYQAVFESTATASFDFGLFEVVTQELDFNESTVIEYQISNQYNSTRDAAPTSIVSNQNVSLNSLRNITNAGDTLVYVNLQTSDKNVSPVLDMDRMSLVAIDNVINNSTNITSPETLPVGGNASAKYITRSVTLAEGFDATGITVYFDLNMQAGSSVQVFAKILAADDNDTLYNKNWIPIPSTKEVTTYSNNYNDFMLNQQWQLTNMFYTSNGVTYTNFQNFQIKVVFYSNNSAIVPQIANFGAIATS